MARQVISLQESELVDDGTVGFTMSPPPTISETQTAVMLLTEHIGYERKRTRYTQEEIDDLHHKIHTVEWATRIREIGKGSPTEMLTEIANLGFSWRDIARVVGVSVPAVQKWRKGERISGPNRLALAGFLAGCDLIIDHYAVRDIASWFEMPIMPNVPISPLDLWQDQRIDLVFDYASGDAEPDQVLTLHNPDWRAKYESEFEVVTESDGTPSIRPKG
ncbi:helix-turn-helix domain-containing protein [Amycolatopsis sp. NPDC005961]|uniref:helix-turn-helix domain-containing protein n=1 Tax=Amycolatopsis sp. NPDC005961 TaxID=3156720 RepID=UPI0033FD5694